MIKIIVFGEDFAHEVFLRILLQRLAVEHGLEVAIQVRSATGGHGRMMRELREYLGDLHRARTPLPDLFVVVRDANCVGYAERAKEIHAAVEAYQGQTALAIPDPHIERWLLIDPRAFKDVLGKGCAPPDMKCDRDRYKQLLVDAIRVAGVDPPLGGVEYTEEIVQAMNLSRAGGSDPSFAHLLRDLRAAFHQWQS